MGRTYLFFSLCERADANGHGEWCHHCGTVIIAIMFGGMHRWWCCQCGTVVIGIVTACIALVPLCHGCPHHCCARHIVPSLCPSLAHGHSGAVNMALSSPLLSCLVAWAGTINVPWLLLLCASHLPAITIVAVKRESAGGAVVTVKGLSRWYLPFLYFFIE